MNIKIYNQQIGLYNSYDKKEAPYEYALTVFIIDCVNKAEELFGVTPHQLFSDSKSAPIPSVRGALMISCYSLLNAIDTRFTTKRVADIFRLDHATLSRYRMLVREKYPYFMEYHTKLDLAVQEIGEKHFPDGVILSTDKMYTFDDLRGLAAFLGGTKSDVERFLQTRA